MTGGTTHEGACTTRETAFGFGAQTRRRTDASERSGKAVREAPAPCAAGQGSGAPQTEARRGDQTAPGRKGALGFVL
ncbi:hypothetical protein [Paenibacillus humicola]|uniref:hypothetical protein n=1 Tax=Paenibacillus humicola TaxID=3110540 RepID=UPI00237B9367|nr:hypothetical protein [Paenibacillus humicola]